ncbi:MAG: MMPL family transporter [Janthinobacterium lividum]
MKPQAAANGVDTVVRVARRARLLILLLWAVGMLACAIVVSRTTFTTDLTAFLPQSPTREQQVLLDQLTDGVVSRLILVGIEGGDAATRAALSKQMAAQLRTDQRFASISNGEPVSAQRDQKLLFDNRYLLSPAVTLQRFSTPGLRAALQETLDLLSSSAGMMIKPLLPRDPTGEIVRLVEGMSMGSRPQVIDGAWASRNGMRALLLAQVRAHGTDTDAQQAAMDAIRQAFALARTSLGAPAATGKLVMTGPGVFAVQSRQLIEQEVTRLSIVSIAIIVTLLLLVYRSLSALALGLLPVACGALAGIAAVSLGFGMIHGITLGFGTTLIGEAVDYSIYLFVQSRQAGASVDGKQTADAAGDWIRDFWPTIRLGILTSVAGFASLLFSSFPGLAQLGLYSIAGLLVAALVTRFVLPHLLPKNFRIRDVSRIGAWLGARLGLLDAMRWPMLIVVVCAAMVVFHHRERIWNTELSSLSPVSAADMATDGSLRADMGAPDVRYMVVIAASERETALIAAEKVGLQLDALVARGELASYESPARFLPSTQTQRIRQASLPSDDLPQRMATASAGLPFRPGLFDPFIADVAAARLRAPLTRADLEQSSLALAVDAMLFQRGSRWTVVLPLKAQTTIDAGTQAAAVTVTAAAPNASTAGGAPATLASVQASHVTDGNGIHGASDGEISAAAVRAAIAASGQQDALFVDLKAESDRLYSGYLRQAERLSLGGLGVICLLLLLVLRSARQMARVLLPLLAATVVVVAMLTLCGQRLTILHLIGLLLIVAVGSNYALFFSGAKRASITPQTLASLLLANLATVAGFGVLGFSEVPILQAIGSTVGPGAVLALLFSAVFAAPVRQKEKR